MFQKCLLTALAIVLCLIVIENCLNKFILNYTTGQKKSILRETSIVAVEQQQAFDSNINNNNDVAVAISSTDDSQMSEAAVILLWWTPFIGEMEYTKNCGNSVCFFTGNRKYINHEKLKVIISIVASNSRNLIGLFRLQTLLFYGSNINKTNMPLPRNQNHVWALLHEESPKNVPSLLFSPMLSMFDVAATFSQQSDMPLTLQYLESVDKLIDRKFFVNVSEKGRLQMTENLAPVLYVQSICNTLSGRDQYVTELMKYIRVDSYGKCLNNNKNMPKTWVARASSIQSTFDLYSINRFLVCPVTTT